MNPSYDAARANWGATWRMPTIDEIKELIDNTTTEWSTQNGVYCCKLTSKKNSNSVFLPAAGRRDLTDFDHRGKNGEYWSSSPYESNKDYGYYLSFDWDNVNWRSFGRRYYGRSVRPVSK